ncbi:hypothetical protein P9477_23735 [Enterobacter mori]
MTKDKEQAYCDLILTQFDLIDTLKNQNSKYVEMITDVITNIKIW